VRLVVSDGWLETKSLVGYQLRKRIQKLDSIELVSCIKNCKTDLEETSTVQYFTILSSGNLAVLAYLRFRSMGLRPNLSIGLPLSDASNLSTVSDYFSVCDLHHCISIQNNWNKTYVIILIIVSIKRTTAVGCDFNRSM
jgi:hypothetical protein